MKNRIFLLLVLLFVAPFSLFSINLTGHVVDEKGKSLSYVSLYLKNAPEVGTITDVNGRFALEVANTHDSLIVALVGYETVVINLHKVVSNKTMKITMKEQPVMLNEVVVSVQKNKNKKKSKKEERAEIQAVLKKVYDRIFVDFPSNNVKYSVVSDLTALSDQKVVMFDEWIGDIVELRDYKGVWDSIQMRMDLEKRYMNNEVKSSLNQYNPNDYSKRDRKLV
ncbi:MAG: carboxypeptidase-like regulatory domain-containing protein, partial [Bacteroidales bacterium]|nr:carboxypeptidase-like regulatory domain-containing protein [Bacteroidales bacterium]